MDPQQYPFDGELFPAKKKEFSETILFVHFFDGNKKVLKRHIELVNDLGFDAIAFNLRDKSVLFQNPFSLRKKIGLKHIYADQVEAMLNLIPGNKIIYSFSNPSASAIEAMYYRNCIDVTALICDSGPAKRIFESVFNMFLNFKTNGFVKELINLIGTPLGWSYLLHSDLTLHLNVFPDKFKILSIRGWKDKLISPDNIDLVFETHTQLDWRKLSLPQAGHLNGLKDFSQDYTQGVKNFLFEVATRVGK